MGFLVSKAGSFSLMECIPSIGKVPILLDGFFKTVWAGCDLFLAIFSFIRGSSGMLDYKAKGSDVLLLAEMVSS